MIAPEGLTPPVATPMKVPFIPKKMPRLDLSSFKVGEKIVFSVKYMGIEAGEVSLETVRFVKIDGKVALHLRGTAKSSPLFSLFYQVDDYAESYVSADKFWSLRHEIHARESRRRQDRIVVFDHVKNRVRSYDRTVKKNKPPEVKEFDMELRDHALDTFAALWWMRTQKFEVGRAYWYDVFDNGKHWRIETKILRKQKIMSPFGKVDTVIIQPFTYFEGVLKKKGEALIWVTDDERKLPIKIESKVKIGTITAELKEANWEGQRVEAGIH